MSFEVSESDGYALEEALRVREKLTGEVVVCSMGPQRVKSVIKDALAREPIEQYMSSAVILALCLPTLQQARWLTPFVKKKDLIFTGLQSDDYGYGQTGVILAELLGLPHATIVIEGRCLKRELRVKRELESGWYQWYTMPTPALLTIQSN